MGDKIKVLILDDMAVVRQALSKILSSHPRIEVVGMVNDPYEAVSIMKTIVPDVITLDVEMPRMDGITFLRKIMTQRPVPTVMISTLTAKGSATAMEALQYGAVEIIEKTKVGTVEQLKESSVLICDIVIAASQAKVSKLTKTYLQNLVFKPNFTKRTALTEATDKIVAIESSTSGTNALRTIVSKLRYDCAGIVVVQHMPEAYTGQFAKGLNDIGSITVKEAKDGDSILKGQMLIAPSGKHLEVHRSGARYYVKVINGPLVNRHRPSVGILFNTVARTVGKNAVGIILTVMSNDGSIEIGAIKEAGGKIYAQDEVSPVVYGMPKVAAESNDLDGQLNIDRFADLINCIKNS